MAATAAMPQPVRSNCTTGFMNVPGQTGVESHHAEAIF